MKRWFPSAANWVWAALLAGLLAAPFAHAAAPPPPAPTSHVADRAGVLKPGTRAALDAQLTQFERDTSSQVVVWIEPKLPPDTTLESYANEVFRSWKIGQARTNNGVLLALFVADRKMRIEVGRGLEGALPDALAGRILDNEIRPRLRAGDWDGGIQAGVNGILAATRGEYRATAAAASRGRGGGIPPLFLFVGVVFLVVLIIAARSGRRRRAGSGWMYNHGGWTDTWGGWGGGGGGGGGWSSGGDSGGGGGGFSGGGGDSGGGGASGSW